MSLKAAQNQASVLSYVEGLGLIENNCLLLLNMTSEGLEGQWLFLKILI